jgi:hypothetical protein
MSTRLIDGVSTELNPARVDLVKDDRISTAEAVDTVALCAGAAEAES